MSTRPSIAVLAMACRYPDAATPEALWQNILDGRRSFRLIPGERLALEDYSAEKIGLAASITPVLAGLLNDWAFDRTRFRISQTTYAATDTAHWLALEVAADALDRIGGTGQLNRDKVAVIVGNTLTGEFSRTAQIPLRLPYLIDRVQGLLAEKGIDAEQISDLAGKLAERISSDFPVPNEDSLAGGLANTIAGRIANHFDFRGGAWTVDGACASSLLAVNDACTRLAEGSIDLALVGGVDLSLDPFELVGFSRNGALARDQMRVFDRRSAGFWPGEGCGFAVLARTNALGSIDAEPLATISGWGVSTDGAGGLTRPTQTGQLAALARAHTRAGIEPANLGYVEAHGTGTAIGDPVEISALAEFVGQRGSPLPVGSIKANIGHTKAASGLAGLIKAVSAICNGVIPPHVSCDEPHQVFEKTGNRLAPALDGRKWPAAARRHAGVSGFGFGGVNAHIVISGPGDHAHPIVPRPSLSQDVELFVFCGASRSALEAELEVMRGAAAYMSLSQLGDAASHVAEKCASGGPHRAAVVAARPDELGQKLEATLASLRANEDLVDTESGYGVSHAQKEPKIGFLFPGQAAPVRVDGGLWYRRFATSRNLLRHMPVHAQNAGIATDIAQPAIVSASAAALAVLKQTGLMGRLAVGHSLGELTALHWAGALSGEDVVQLASLRGKAMAENAVSGGAMMRVELSPRDAEPLAHAFGLSVACENAATETVVAGPLSAIDSLTDALRETGTAASRLSVSHAFHTSDMAPAMHALETGLETVSISPLQQRVLSTITGDDIPVGEDLKALLLHQLVAPVRFASALERAAKDCDLFIEAGPGSGLTRLARLAGHRAVSVDAHGSSFRGLLNSLAAAFLSGAALDLASLFSDRPIRVFDPGHRPLFLANPCGRRDGQSGTFPARPASRAVPKASLTKMPSSQTGQSGETTYVSVNHPDTVCSTDNETPVLDTLLHHVSNELALPLEAVTSELHFLDDLHLNSLAVGRIVAAVSQQIGVAPPVALTDFANATLAELADTLNELRALGAGSASPSDRFEGVAPWIERYRFEWKDAELPQQDARITWSVPQGGKCSEPAPGKRNASETVAGDLIRIDDWQTVGALEKMWRAVRASHLSGCRHIALFHSGAPITGFARSLAHENLFDRVTVIESPCTPQLPGPVRQILEAAPGGYSEWRSNPDGTVSTPVFRRMENVDAPTSHPCWSALDVVAVTGGARGIGAECALRLAERTGARLLLLGRSPQSHPDVSTTLDRAHAAGITALYRTVDVICPDQIAKAFSEAEAVFGAPVTALLHAAGVNRPDRFADIDEATLAETLHVKITGLHALLDVADLEKIRTVIGFGSIIGRLGLAGETHYALANAAQSALLEDLAAARPNIRVLAPEWSVWTAVGMGERLGTLERLAETGVEALPLDQALDIFEHLVVDGTGGDGTSVITGRFGSTEQLDLGPPVVPLHRFLETVQVHYPGLEIVADSRLSRGTDPYLCGHVIDDETVLPGVMILEAMAAAVRALLTEGSSNRSEPLSLENVRFDRSVILPARGDLTVRIAALRRGPKGFSCAMRANDDGFSSVCAQADIRLDRQQLHSGAVRFDRPEQDPVSADPLYGSLFFNAGPFRKVRAYRRLSAFELSADLDPASQQRWFGSFLPQDLLLGDPGNRDAALHALQVAVPQRRVVPVSVDQIVIADPQKTREKVDARQIRATKSEFVFDIAFRDAEGRIVEVWQGAKFRAIGTLALAEPPEILFVPWLEREIALASGRSDVHATRVNGQARSDRRNRAASQLGIGRISHRGDGKPLLASGTDNTQVSLSHSDGISLLVTAAGPVGCDLELLGPEADDVVVADTDTWCAREALRKCGIRQPPRLHEPDAMRQPRPLKVAGFEVLTRQWRQNCIVAIAIGAPTADCLHTVTRDNLPTDRQPANPDPHPQKEVAS